jgi:hypothetical protein
VERPQRVIAESTARYAAKIVMLVQSVDKSRQLEIQIETRELSLRSVAAERWQASTAAAL